MIAGHEHVADLIMLGIASLIAWVALINAVVWIIAVRAAHRHADRPHRRGMALGVSTAQDGPGYDDDGSVCRAQLPRLATLAVFYLTCPSAGSRTATGQLACRVSCWLIEPSGRPPTSPCPRGSNTMLRVDRQAS